jgi:selenocysteine lyase/cysteine desulfurase
LGTSLLLLRRIGLDLIQEKEQALTKRALHGLAQIPGLRIYGIKDPSSPRFARKGGVILFRLKNLMPNRVAQKLAGEGIGVRYGCHCAHLMIKHLLNIPPPLERLQHVILFLFPNISLPGLTRVSLGIENDEKDVDALIHALEKIARRHRAGVNRQSDIRRRMDDFIAAAVRRVY